MRLLLALLFVLVSGTAQAQTSVTSMGSPNPGVALPNCVSTDASGSSLVCSGHNLYGFYCGAIGGGAAGYCATIDATAAPSAGAITPLDFCYFDTTAKGCSLGRQPGPPRYYTHGVVVLITSASSPYTYTTGTATGAMSADVK